MSLAPVSAGGVQASGGAVSWCRRLAGGTGRLAGCEVGRPGRACDEAVAEALGTSQARVVAATTAAAQGTERARRIRRIAGHSCPAAVTTNDGRPGLNSQLVRKPFQTNLSIGLVARSLPCTVEWRAQEVPRLAGFEWCSAAAGAVQGEGRGGGVVAGEGPGEADRGGGAGRDGGVVGGVGHPDRRAPPGCRSRSRAG